VSRPGRSLPQGKTRYPLYRRLGGPQGQSGQAQEISPPKRIRYPDRPARSQSLYRLSYPAHLILLTLKNYYLYCLFYDSVVSNRNTFTLLSNLFLLCNKHNNTQRYGAVIPVSLHMRTYIVGQPVDGLLGRKMSWK
jgi:hypothetical protein